MVEVRRGEEEAALGGRAERKRVDARAVEGVACAQGVDDGRVLLGDGLVVKIGDFGYAKRLSAATERRMSMCGTPNYIAPEILQGQQGPGHSFEVDLWTVGIVM